MSVAISRLVVLVLLSAFKDVLMANINDLDRAIWILCRPFLVWLDTNDRVLVALPY